MTSQTLKRARERTRKVSKDPALAAPYGKNQKTAFEEGRARREAAAFKPSETPGNIAEEAAVAAANADGPFSPIPEYNPDAERAALADPKVKLTHDLEHYLRDAGSRAAASGVMYASNWQALVAAGMLTDENATAETANRTIALMEALDHEIGRIAHKNAGLPEPEPYTLTDEEKATVARVAREQSYMALREPPPVVVAILGQIILVSDPDKIGEFRRRAREAGVDIPV